MFVLLLLLSLLVLLHNSRVECVDQTLEKTPGSSLDMSRHFRKALLEALERLEKEQQQQQQQDTPTPPWRHTSIRTKKEEQNTVVPGGKIRDKELREETLISTFNNGANTKSTSSSSSLINNSVTRMIDRSENISSKVAVDNILATSSDTSHPALLLTNKQSLSVTQALQPVHTLVTPKPTASTPIQQQQQPKEDEDETKAKVEDVQFIHAPLVAAFTVQQDDKGLPQKVIPIYGNNNKQQQQQQQQPPPIQQVNSVRQYQASLEEKQRTLEQQIRVLQEQRRQQELLLLQQQQLTLQSQQQQQQQRNTVNVVKTKPQVGGTVVSLQPSVSFLQPQKPSVPALNRQHFSRQEVPVKPAVVFRPDTFEHLQQSLPNPYRDNVFNTDNYLQNFFYRQRTLVPPPPHTNRVFRHEAHVANVGQNNPEYNYYNNNNNQYRYNTLQYSTEYTTPWNTNNNNNNNIYKTIDTQQFTPNLYDQQQHNLFTSTANNVIGSSSGGGGGSGGAVIIVPKFNVNDKLKNLIFQSGLGLEGRTQEDLNIVSKVLSLDHSSSSSSGHYGNFLFGESNILEKRIPFDSFNKT